MQLFQGFFFFFLREVARGKVTSCGHGRFPCRRRALGVSSSAESDGGESLPLVLQHHCGSPLGSGEPLGSLPDIWSAASPSERCSCALRRFSPPPALPGTPPPTRDALSAPRQVLGNFHGGPGPLSCLGLLRLVSQDPHSPPLQEKKRIRSHQLIQQRAAAFRCAPDFADKRPGIGGNQGPPPSPIRKIASFDPFRSATLGWSVRPSLPPLLSGDRGKQ